MEMNRPFISQIKHSFKEIDLANKFGDKVKFDWLERVRKLAMF